MDTVKNLLRGRRSLSTTVLLCVILAIISVSLLSGCSKKSTNPDASLVGTWEATEYYDDGVWYDTEYDITITFNSNKTGVSSFEGDEVNFTWSTSGDTLTLVGEGVDNESVTFSISGNTLIITDIEDGLVEKYKYVRV